MTRRHKIIAGVVAGALVIAAVAWWRLRGGKPETGFIVGLVAVDGDTAILSWRANYQDDPSRGWVGRIEGTGRAKWVREVPDLPFSTGPGNGLIVVGDVVAVRYAHHVDYDATDHAVAAFALSDGKPLWDIVLTPYHPEKLEGGGTSEARLPTYHSAIAVGDDRIAFWANDGSKTNVYVVDAATGEITSKQGASDYSYAAMTLGTRVFTHYVEQTMVLDVASDGAGRTIQTSYEGCVIGDDYLTIEWIDEQPALVWWQGGDPAERRILAQPFVPTGPAERHPTVRRCGRFGERLILLLQVHPEVGFGDRTVVWIGDASGHTLHTIDLGKDMLWDGAEGVSKRAVHAAPLAGELTRFAPYVLSQYGAGDDGGVTKLIMLDLQDGKIAWSGPHDERAIHGSLFRGGDRWFLDQGWPGWTLLSFDGNTGELSAAKQLHDYHGIGHVQPAHHADGKIWVYGGTWLPFGTPPVAILDAATLEPTFVRHLEITDLTDEMRAALQP